MLLLLGLTACNRREVFMQFQPTDIESWERTEQLTFAVDSLPATDHYLLRVLLRKQASDVYPFQQLTLVVRQRWTLPQPPEVPPEVAARRKYLVQRPLKDAARYQRPDSLLFERSDTLHCTLTTPQGRSLAGGLSLQEYAFALTRAQLPQGARGQITIRHAMLRNMLPGISDVGVALERD